MNRSVYATVALEVYAARLLFLLSEVATRQLCHETTLIFRIEALTDRQLFSFPPLVLHQNLHWHLFF